MKTSFTVGIWPDEWPYSFPVLIAFSLTLISWYLWLWFSRFCFVGNKVEQVYLAQCSQNMKVSESKIYFIVHALSSTKNELSYHQESGSSIWDVCWWWNIYLFKYLTEERCSICSVLLRCHKAVIIYDKKTVWKLGVQIHANTLNCIVMLHNLVVTCTCV